MSKPQSPLWPGVPFALGSALLFGASAPLSKALMGSIDPWLLAGILYLGAGFGLAIVQLVRGRIGLPSAEAQLQGSDIPRLLAVIFFGGILGSLFLMFGLSRTSASTGSLLLNLEGLATLSMAWIVFRENVDRRLLLGAAAILGGAVLLSWTGHGLHLDAGGLWIAAACLCWGIDNNLTQKLSAADPMQIVMIKGLAAGLVNVALALSLGAPLPGAAFIAIGALVGFFGVGVSLVLFTLALRHLGTARTGAYFSTAPFIGAALAVVLFHDSVSLQLLAAGCLMALGVWLHLSEQHDHAHDHEALEHEHIHVHDAHHQHDHDAADEMTGHGSQPHAHWHRHRPLRHAHAHYPDLHHRHGHSGELR